MVIIETKEITPFFTDRGTLVCSSEEIKEKLDGIELLFRNCNDKLAEAEMSACDYAFQADAISTMTENMQKLYLYASRAHEHVSEALDYPLYLHFKTYATETITSIMLNEITTDNTFHLTEYVKIKRQGQYFVNKRVKDTLTMEDFLGLQEITPENGMPILENMETISEFASLFRKDYATMNEEGESLQQYLEKYVNTGDIEHKGYHPLADMLSGIADITIVKPVIECVTGKDMITGEHLTEYDLTWKKIGIIIDLFTLGQGSLAIEGADTFLDGLKLAGKTFALDAISTTASYGAAYIGTELGLSEENILLLSLLTGCTVSVVGGKVLLKDSGGTTKTLSNEQVDEILKGSTGSVEEVIESGSNTKIYNPVEYKGTVKVNGEIKDVSRKVYQRNDIDFNYFDETTGLTNLERMQAGKPPIGSDGNPIQLHHILQKEVGPMVEIREITHQEYYSQLHGLIEDGASFRNNPVLNKQYNNFRRSYWKWRAEQIIGGN